MKNNQLNQANQSSISHNLNNSLRKQGKKVGRVFLFLLITLALFGCASDTTGASGGDTTSQVPQAPKVFSLTNVFNISDDDSLALNGATTLTTAVVGGRTYLFVAGFDDDGFSIFSIADNGSLANITNVSDNESLNLDNANAVTTAEIGGTNYLFVTGERDSGFSVFSVAGDGSLANITNVNDDDNLKLNSAFGATTAVVGDTTYLFVAGLDDDGVSVFSVADNGSLANVFNIDDGSDGSLELDGANSPTTAVVGNNTYLFVAGLDDGGVSVFSVADNGSLVNVFNIDDNSSLKLNGATFLHISVVGGRTYLFVAGFVDDGFSIFSVSDNGSLANITNVSDNGSLNLDNANAVTTAEIGGTTYLFVTGGIDDGFGVFSIAGNGSLSNITNVNDDENLELDTAGAVTTAEVGGSTYVFVAGTSDDGVSVFRAELK